MTCGPDIFRLIDIADRVIQRHATRITPPAGVGPSRRDPWTEVVALYEQGLIDDATFQRVRRLAEQGRLRPVDVAVLHYEARKRGPHRRNGGEEEDALHLLRARRARLLSARRTSEATLARVEQQIGELEARIREKEEAARAVVARDEERARRYLEDKILFEETKARLDEQAQALREDIQALEDVLVQVEAKIVELEAMHTRATVHTTS